MEVPGLDGIGSERTPAAPARAWTGELIRTAVDGVFVSDDSGVIIEVNDAWGRIVGYGPDGVPYRPPYPWWPDAVTEAADRAVLDAALLRLKDEATGADEVPFRHRDGRRVWVSLTVTTVREPGRDRGLLVGTVRDVTAQRRARRRQERAAEVARRLTGATSRDEVLTIAAACLAEAFAAPVFIGRDGFAQVHTADGPVPAATVAPAVLAALRAADPPAGAVDGGAVDGGAVDGGAVDGGAVDGGAAGPVDGVPVGPVDGIAARIRTGTEDWWAWIALAAPRRVDPGEYLLLGLLTAGAAQALQTVDSLTAQQRITDDLRAAVARAGERERSWHAEAAVRAEHLRAERRFRSLVEASTAVVWSADPAGRFSEPQPSFQAYTGQPWPEHGGTGWLATVHPDDRGRIGAAWSAAVAGGTGPYEDRCRVRRGAGGPYRHVVVRAVAIRGDDGAISEWIGTFSDVHDRVVAEDAARRSAAITDALVQASPIGFGWADPRLHLQAVNPALARIDNLDAAGHVGRLPRELWPATGDQIETHMRRAMSDGPVTDVEFTEPDPGGDPARRRVASYFPIELAGSAGLVGVGFTVVDVTERTRLLQALGAERTRYEQLASTDVLAVFGGVEDRITEANDAFLAMLGYTADDLRAGRLTWPVLTPPDWADTDQRTLGALTGNGRATALTKEYLHSDGHRVPVLIGVVALRQDPLQWLAYAADLSAEHAAQAELRLFQTLVQRSGDLVAVAGMDGRLRYLNPAGRELAGLGDDELPASLTDLATPAARTAWLDTVIPAVLDTGQHRAETQLRRQDTGAVVDVDQQTFTVAGDTTDARFLAVVSRDVTDRQQSLRRAQALARFAGALSTAADRGAVLAAVTSLAPAVFGAAAAACATLSDRHDGLEVVTSRPGGTLTPATVPVDAGTPLALAVATNRPVDVPAAGGPATVTACCLPLRYRDGAPLGAIEVRWETAVRHDGALTNLLDTVAGLTTQALQRAELTASATAMATLAARLTVTRSPAEAIAVIISEVAVVLGARMPGLAIRESDGQVRHYSQGLPDELAAAYTEFGIDDPRPVAEVLRTGRRIILADRPAFRARYPGLVDHAGRYGMVTTVALPLLDSQGRPVAALGLGWTRYRRFGAADLARLDTVADLCEQTLERTRLVAAEHQLITRLSTRLQTTATTIPDSLDIAVRYRPAMTGLNLGGDWYDLINLPGGRLAVVVGDVVGHHIEAAADMAQLRTLLNTLIRMDVPLDQVFARFTTLVGRGFWGTAVIVVADPAARRVEIARAGHPHPVLLRPGRPARQVPSERTPPLGLITGPIQVSTVEFHPGDALVAYTDGLIERRDRLYDDSVADVHATLDGVPAGAAAAQLADALLAAAVGSDDDQALVVVRYQPAPAAAQRILLRTGFDAGRVSEVRRNVHRLAGQAGLGDDALDDFTIAVYELLTNAIRHGGGRGELILRAGPAGVTCDITDTGGGFTQPEQTRAGRLPDPSTNGGRGLWLARHLTDSLDITDGPGGVHVSATMRLPPAGGQ